MQSINGTSLYAAPEIWNHENYNIKIDTWAIGCILYELCKLDYAFYEENVHALYNKVCSADYSPIPTYYSENMKKAISQLLEIDQEKRLTIKRFLIQDYIVKIAQKVGEEALETVIEATNGTDEHLIYEASDLLYHLLVLLTHKGKRIEDVANELQKRHNPEWDKKRRVAKAAGQIK